MAQKTIYVCDRCGGPRFAILDVDLDIQDNGNGETVTEMARIDVCAPCLARALKLMLPYVPMTVRRTWYDEFREVTDTHG